jgi:hypothetical protein
MAKSSQSPDRAALAEAVESMVSDWETSDELASEFAVRLLGLFDEFLPGFQKKIAKA